MVVCYNRQVSLLVVMKKKHKFGMGSGLLFIGMMGIELLTILNLHKAYLIFECFYCLHLLKFVLYQNVKIVYHSTIFTFQLGLT